MPNNSRIHLSGWEFSEHWYRNSILPEKANGISKVSATKPTSGTLSQDAGLGNCFTNDKTGKVTTHLH